MRIKKVNRRKRRNFWADYECEYCGYVIPDLYGYDDNNYHLKVIPKLICPGCGRTAEQKSQTKTT